MKRLRRWWVGCDRCRSRGDHQAVLRENRRLMDLWTRGLLVERQDAYSGREVQP